MWEGGDITTADIDIAPSHHFQVSEYSTTQIRVRGGTLETFAHGVRYGTSLTCDGGPSGDLANVKTADIAGSGVNYVVLTKDYALVPTTLQVACSLVAPDSASKVNRLIAHFTVAGGAIVAGTLVQDWNGGNIREYWNQPDDLSLNYNASNTLQDKDWATASSAYSLGATDLFMFQDNTTVGELLTKKYVSWDELIDELAAYIMDVNGPWNGTKAPWVKTPLHHRALGDIAANNAGDDHDGGLGGVGHTGNHPYVSGKGRGCTGTPANTVANGNAFAAGSGLGDDAYALSIDPDDRKLYNGAASGTRATLDWYNRRLHGDWTQYDTDSHLFVKGTEAIELGNPASGGLQVAGGASVGEKIQADGFYITDESALNYWIYTRLNVDVDNIYLYADGELTLDSDHNVTITADQYLSLNFPAASLKINGSFWQEETVKVVVNGVEESRTILAKVP
jgi:hypothetical protein